VADSLYQDNFQVEAFLTSGLKRLGMSKVKRNSLLLLSFAAILILVLASGLPGLQLAEGQPFSLGQAQTGVSTSTAILPGGDILMWIFRAILALALVFLPLYIIYSLFTPEGRKRLFADIVLIAGILWVSEYLHKANQNAALKQPVAMPGAAQIPGLGLNAAPTAQFSASPPSWLALVVILTISILIVAVTFAAVRFIRHRKKSEKNSYEDLAREAEMAIESLRSGGDLSISILHCYQEMSRIVKKEKGIAREATMTPREFEERLEGKGLPRESIRTLTRLFEQVRYGAVPTGIREENLALACLTDIVNACKTIGELDEAR
jgi:magnesium-transporting ATPase (P-type)